MILDHAAPDLSAERLEVMDALYRFGAGVDHNDTDLLATAFGEDATVDFGPCGRAMGLDFPVLTGRDTIVGFVCGNAEKQTTSHAITNSRCVIKEGSAVLRTLVDATHLQRDDRSRCCRMMNWYDVRLFKEADLWQMRRIVISNAWFTGDVQVLLGK